METSASGINTRTCIYEKTGALNNTDDFITINKHLYRFDEILICEYAILISSYTSKSKRWDAPFYNHAWYSGYLHNLTDTYNEKSIQT